MFYATELNVKVAPFVPSLGSMAKEPGVLGVLEINNLSATRRRNTQCSSGFDWQVNHCVSALQTCCIPPPPKTPTYSFALCVHLSLSLGFHHSNHGLRAPRMNDRG